MDCMCHPCKTFNIRKLDPPLGGSKVEQVGSWLAKTTPNKEIPNTGLRVGSVCKVLAALR